MATITAKALRDLVAKAPDDALLVVPGSDHSYRLASIELTTALQERPRQFTEDHGEDITPEAEYGKRVPILLVQ